MQTTTNSSKLTLHFVESETRTRADLVRVGNSIGCHCELYSDLSELATHPPRSGVIFLRDRHDDGGLAAVFEQLAALDIALPVIAMDEKPLPTAVVNAVKAGALDYLPLPLQPDRLDACLSRNRLEAERVSFARKRIIETRRLLSALSGREREVLDALADGSSNKQIARQLNISPRTVEIHRSNMMAKLGATHSAQAIRMKVESTMDRQMVLA